MLMTVAPLRTALAGGLAALAAHQDGNADLGPLLGDDLQGVDLRRVGVGGLDHQVGAPPVRQVADAVVVAPEHAHVVQQRIGLLRVVVGPGLAVGFAVERRAGQQGVGAGQGGALVEHLIQLLPVGRQGKRAAKAGIPQHRLPARRHGVEVGVERQLGTASDGPKPELDLSRGLPPPSGPGASWYDRPRAIRSASPAAALVAISRGWVGVRTTSSI